MKQKFPRFTREENRSCKLSDKQILEIQKRRKAGETKEEIAVDYNITPTAVYYWCLSPNKRAELIRNQHKRKQKKMSEEEKKKYYKEYRQRKLKTHPELVEYEKQFNADVQRLRPSYKRLYKKWGKLRWQNNREEEIKRHKAWVEKNREYLREYQKKWRAKRKNESE
jgi:hypothetical protein